MTAQASADAATTTASDTETKPTDTSAAEKLAAVQAELDKERGKNQRTFAELTDTKKKLEKFSGYDPEKAKAMEEEVENLRKELAENSPEKKKEYLKQQEERQAQAAEKERKGLTDTIDSLTKKVNDFEVREKQYKIVDKMVREYGPKLTEDAQEYFRILVDRHIDLDGDELIVKDADGQVEYSGAGKKMTPDEWFTQFSSKHSTFLRSTYKGGGQTDEKKTTETHAATGTNGKAPSFPTNWATMSIDQQAEWFRKNPAAKGLVRM